ncbi:MAG: Hsp20/alpha crystallin family protein [Patescibacteria group bacterium]|nr:Hsp20/alpha crystallin family protein [bacterium]MDZ4240673.1 Hsp20/alpha crystallin family protein [Patescibacteria group bacterium]
MPKEKRSFFERLTGSVRLDTTDADEFIEEENGHKKPAKKENGSWMEEESGDGQLTVDVYQTASEIVIKTMVAGVKPEDLDIDITRDMVTIKGKRENERVVEDDDYYHKELYWGSFSRTVILPQEVDVEGAEAIERHGLLIVRLPKINKDKQTKLRVRSTS